MSIVYSQGEIHLLCKRLQKDSIRDGKKLTVGLTNGCFEILHHGHAVSLQEAAKLCDLLVVGINSDSSMARIKRMPRIRDVHRAAVVAAIKGVYAVIIFEDDTPADLLRIMLLDVYIKGSDYQTVSPGGITRSLAERMGIRVEYTPFVEGVSTSEIIRRFCGEGKAQG